MIDMNDLVNSVLLSLSFFFVNKVILPNTFGERGKGEGEGGGGGRDKLKLLSYTQTFFRFRFRYFIYHLIFYNLKLVAYTLTSTNSCYLAFISR